MAQYVLKLYITGQSPRAERAIANLERICEERLRGRYELTVVDVLEEPELAEKDRVLATPTLIKALPAPAQRVIGDLSDTDRVLMGLDLDTNPPAPEAPA